MTSKADQVADALTDFQVGDVVYFTPYSRSGGGLVEGTVETCFSSGVSVVWWDGFKVRRSWVGSAWLHSYLRHRVEVKDHG